MQQIQYGPFDVLAPRIPPANPETYKLDQAVKPTNKIPAAATSSTFLGLSVIWFGNFKLTQFKFIISKRKVNQSHRFLINDNIFGKGTGLMGWHNTPDFVSNLKIPH